MKKAFLRFYRNARGATAIEYGLIVAGIGIFTMLVIFSVGTDLKGVFQGIDTSLSTAVTNAGG